MSKRPQLAMALLGGLCVLGCGLVGNGLYYAINELGSKTPAKVTAIRVGFVAALSVLAYLFYRFYKHQFGAYPALWLGAFVGAVLAGAGADSWQGWLESLVAGTTPGGFPAGPLLYSLAFFLVLLWIGAMLRRIPSVVGVQNAPAEPRRHLVIFLSDIKDVKTYANCAPSWLVGSGRNLCDDLKRLAEEKQSAKREGNPFQLWPWEQPLRAIHHHFCNLCNRELQYANSLESVALIASKESIVQAPLFARLLESYPALQKIDFKVFVRVGTDEYQFTDLRTATASGGFDFENFTELSQAVHGLLSQLAEQTLQESEIMIDFTSGKKVTSVVAAAMTFNRDVRAQYVQTEDPWNVLSYRVITLQRPI